MDGAGMGVHGGSDSFSVVSGLNLSIIVLLLAFLGISVYIRAPLTGGSPSFCLWISPCYVRFPGLFVFLSLIYLGISPC